MAAKRCPTCLVNWPTGQVQNISFDRCHSCMEPTDAVQNARPLGDDEAYDLAVHMIHDRQYAEWDESHDSARLDPANETDPHVLGIFARAQDLLSSRKAEIARAAAIATP